MDRLLVVGAGITGALTAAFLREEIPKLSRILIYEKAKYLGGRMSTSRGSSPTLSTLDLGAQYTSVTAEYTDKHKSIHDDLLKQGVIEPLKWIFEGELSDLSTNHYVTPAGYASLVKSYMDKAGAEIKYNQTVTAVSRGSNNQLLRVETEEGMMEEFDTVILSMPVPQILQLKGDLQDIINGQPGLREKLKRVTYSSRYALGLFFAPGTSLDVPWAAKYVEDNACIRFLSIDTKKRGIESKDVAPSLVVHTSVPFGLKHLEEDKSVVQAKIIEHLKELWPDLPEPHEMKIHRWKFSQVYHEYEGCPGCIVLQEQPLLILAGDAFVHSNFDGCVESAQAVTRAVKKAWTVA